MPDPVQMPIELVLLAWSTVLLFAYIMVQGHTMNRDRGLAWNAGARDGTPAPLGVHAGRAQRALDNFKETYPVFIALALGLAVSGRTGGVGEIGAETWFAARIVYLPLYLLGTPYVRTLCWAISLLGLLLMLVRLL